MVESESLQKLRDGLKTIRAELQELLDALTTEADAPPSEPNAPPPVDETSGDFFEQITQGDQLPDADLHRKVLRIITGLGYASTLVLQHRLEISFRQASTILAGLERDGLIGPAHGFRPHKVLRPAYALLERLESKRESKTH